MIPAVGSDTKEEIVFPTLTSTFSRVMRVSTGSDVSFAPSIEQSAMISGCGRGHSHDFGGRGCGSVREHGSYGGRQVPLRKASGNVGIVDVLITSSKSAGRNLVDLSGHS